MELRVFRAPYCSLCGGFSSPGAVYIAAESEIEAKRLRESLVEKLLLKHRPKGTVTIYKEGTVLEVVPEVSIQWQDGLNGLEEVTGDFELSVTPRT